MSRSCAVCSKPLRYYVEFDLDGVKLELCGGCAGEATAVLAYGSEAETTLDWAAVRSRAMDEAAKPEPRE